MVNPRYAPGKVPTFCLQGTVEEEESRKWERIESQPTNKQIKREGGKKDDEGVNNTEQIKSKTVCEIEKEEKVLLTKLLVHVNQHFLGGHVGPSEIDSAGFTLGRPLGAT